ncbi:hypothetical protein [Collimonas fungivorans]|uniref:Uncharacterized protein n=1 Tax=Collimonas fungivorans (strain Ter331) TaxID=1005048 RepID=G0AGW9_COLFT|nr:hypothetical protein [Collimonas fungivorans]AEK61974.1 hypothetical protein CFU_2144 [Collimonas fungivorans Ter331]
MRISKYLDQLQKALDVKTDKDVAKLMGWTHSVPSNWRKGHSFMTNQAAASVSEKLGIPVIEVIAAVEADREEVSGQKSFWTDFFQRTAATAASVAVLGVVTLFLTPTPSQATPLLKANTPTICIM